jgi:proprotein convertase subtilisin/kexin type 2
MSSAPPPPPACSIRGGRGRASSHLSSPLFSSLLLPLLLLLLSSLPAISTAGDIFTNHFLVHLDPSHGHPDPPALARDIAKRNGFHSLGPLLNSPHEFHFIHSGLASARHKRSLPHTRKLKTDPQVHHVFQQTGFKRVKRGYREVPDSMALGPKSVVKKSSWSELRASLDGEVNPAVVHSEDHFQQMQEGASMVKRGYNSLTVDNLVGPPPTPQEPSDPLFPYQWYLKNTGQNGGKARLDLNVEAAWAQGITGLNVTTAIMDDGVDYMHPDIINNYNARASYDFSSNDPFPYPRYTDDWFNSHGTRCAGEVSAAKDNDVCGVGVAYNSLVAGIRMLDQPYMTDLIEANSMGHQPDLIDIYSASWGPTDDGRTVDGPRNATMRAIVRGVNEGRKGLGNIYVWASGDGGEDDDCNCDGYAASMWTISINSAINTGENAHYDESCSSTLASTFSNGAKDPNTGVATTDLYGKCTKTHSGTSAAAPEAAGVFALAIEANRLLTWRDMQHLTVLTSKRNSLFDSKSRFFWNMNGVGLEFNHLFGFGVLDAGAMVALAKQWKTVPARFHCEAGSSMGTSRIPMDKSLFLTIDTKACAGLETEVNYLEHVQAVVTLNSTRRGAVQLFLRSPMGTRSMILSERPNDADALDGFTKWPFMTTHTWAEYPRGKWSLEIEFVNGPQQEGFVKEWTLLLHGTKEAPYTNLPVTDPHSKLAVVKKAHEDRKKM